MKKNYILIGLSILILLVFAYYFYSTVTRADKIAVRIEIFPSTADITIDGEKIDTGVAHLKPGIYEIKASESGYTDFSNTLDVNASTTTYAISLEPRSEEAKQWYEDHQEEYIRVRKLSDKATREAGEYFHKKNPIASKLPYKTFMYSIGYQGDPSDPTSNSIIVTIDAPEGYRQSALHRIRQLGHDPTDLNIIFKNYENPFPL